MLFNSYIFVLLFLPLCIIGYFFLNHYKWYNLGQVFLLIMSLWFYAYFNISYLPIILTSVIVNFSVYKLLNKTKNDFLRKTLLVAGLLFNLGILGYYKYTDFLIENINTVFKLDWPLKHILLPLGISFFTFQQISFVIDSYKKEVPEYDFLRYACFVTFFPQLIAGPIVTHDELVPQFLDKEKKRFDWNNFNCGIYLFSIGLAKKVLIADTLARPVEAAYADLSIIDTTNGLIVMLAYTLQIYFDFSGYADMAIGLGKMLNIDIPMNFNSPYKAITIDDHWKRWHITLTRFLTKYLYIPLGGNRKGKYRTYINTMIVFTISGLWHGAAWHYVIWGMLHGAFIVVTRHCKTVFNKIPKVINWFITFSFINIGFIVFRSNTLTQATDYIRNMFTLGFGPINKSVSDGFKFIEFEGILSMFTDSELVPIIILFAIAMIIILACKNAYEMTKDFKPSIKSLLASVVLLLWSVYSFAGVSTFIYFNF